MAGGHALAGEEEAREPEQDHPEPGDMRHGEPRAAKRPRQKQRRNGHHAGIERARRRRGRRHHRLRYQKDIGRAEGDDHQQHTGRAQRIRPGPPAQQHRQQQRRRDRKAQGGQILRGEPGGHPEAQQHQRAGPDQDCQKGPEQAGAECAGRLCHACLHRLTAR
ncbi:hypothetical protein Ga0080574_TMP981 [Salipiger abyssi]|uniref:Uncharacterized protein n=1 Tax=Salipiger abyssi TaxID=1250539 RepID=A0A1P8UPK4_9RHOB|nr:hypothetical protein Ga0080574_TMP981 [Salipiger abyssi]